MKTPSPVTIDFETFGIESRPDYPPKPVGVSIKYQGKTARYYAWGHAAGGNNCTLKQARTALVKAYKRRDGLLFQNAKFDVDVAEVHFGLSVPSWQRIHDTMFLLFLDDPHQRELGLKPSATRLLNWPAEEQDAVRDWLLEHQPVEGVRISKGQFGAYIAHAPGDVVGPYANGDVERTEALFHLLHPSVIERGMSEAYDRERRLMPVLLEMERQGVPVDLDRLRADVSMYLEWWTRVDAWVCKRLRAKDLNIDSGAQLMSAMIDAGVVDTDHVPRTKTGKLSTSKASLLDGVTDKTLLAVLSYRASLKTCMSTFMQPWLAVAERSGGLIYTNWNQVRGSAGGGTRTGRLSSSPNFQNIPNDFDLLWAHEKRGAGLPRCPWPELPALPSVRSYIVPFEGHTLIDRDWAGQELRCLGHFDGGEILQQYTDDPWTDFHANTQAALADVGIVMDRKPVKNVNFGILYGMGIGLLASAGGVEYGVAKRLKATILRIYPGLADLYAEMRKRARLNLPFRTWGAREIYCEQAKLIEGQMRTFDYKMVNGLIQGSAADATKEALIRFADVKREDWRVLFNVHDQLTASVPMQERDEGMQVLKQCMESLEFDVPMLSEGKVGENWGALIDYDKRGEWVCSAGTAPSNGNNT